ncbi:PREDICTED: N-lysine methyltransferase SMYD2-like [Rhagoletis zephyria]|uniref:N-lysine methyltransferase SMYD2-like n=1 Tax=Rhagoletis zephyria TaxID=28612 RepID=UPI00081164EB|nr:PREDICTED: N-lysine methyltransferase SMYD2-like [Rhagoletis zephyria]
MADSIAQADRNYEPGDIIVECRMPLVATTKYEHRLFTCDSCMRKVDSTIVCPKCRKVYYCSRQCQDSHSIHQLECPILSRQKQLQFESKGFDYMQRLTLRLVLLMINQPEVRTREYRLHNGMTRRLDDMECHSNELKDTPQFQGILNYFKLYKIENYDYDLLLRAYGLLHVNSFGIDSYYSAVTDNATDVQIDHCGSALYIEASVFDHSCVPNACASGDGMLLEIRALSPICKGEQIYIDYLQDIQPRVERQSILADRYFFTCACSRGCSETLNSEKAFDAGINYKSFDVLNRLIDSMLQTNSSNIDAPFNKTSSDINWSQLYRFYKQRLRLQEAYYKEAGYHPCLSLYYREFLRFVLVNQHRFSEQEPPSQQENSSATKNAVAATTVAPVASLSGHEIEEDLLEFGVKAKEHLKVTHGVNHSFYSKLFAASGEQEEKRT